MAPLLVSTTDKVPPHHPAQGETPHRPAASQLSLTFEVKNQAQGFVLKFIYIYILQLYTCSEYIRLALGRGLTELRDFFNDIWMFMVS